MNSVDLSPRNEIDDYRLPAREAGVHTVHVFIRAAGSGDLCRPKTGLSAADDHQANYLGPDDRQPRPLDLRPGSAPAEGCGFFEIDADRMPGLYGFQVTEHLRAPGYTHVCINFAGAEPCYLQIHGVNYDPYDRFAMMLTTWVRSNCHENLTSGIRRSLPVTLRPLLEPET